MEIYDDEVAKKNSDRGFYSAAVILAYKIYEYVREARESEASVETLIEKAVEERTQRSRAAFVLF